MADKESSSEALNRLLEQACPETGPTARSAVVAAIVEAGDQPFSRALATALSEVLEAERATAPAPDREPAPARTAGLNRLNTAVAIVDSPEAETGVTVAAGIRAEAFRRDYETAAASLQHRRSADSRRIMDLVERAQSADSEAFGSLYDQYKDTVFRYIYYRVGGRATAEDLTSETFARALRRIGTFTWQGRDFGAWLVTIARNLVADHFKSSRFRLQVTVAEVADSGEAESSIEETFVGSLPPESLLDTVRKLNPQQQEVITLRFLQGLSITETARVMGKNEGAVKTLQYRAVRTLARLLPDDAQPPRPARPSARRRSSPSVGEGELSPLAVELAQAWSAIQRHHPEVSDLAEPEALISEPASPCGGELSFQRLLHEAAHAVAAARGIRDTSRAGRYHNRHFLAIAEELGLEHSGEPSPSIGFALVTLTSDTKARYRPTIDRLDRALDTPPPAIRHSSAAPSRRS